MKLPSVISDHMVLQKSEKVPIWGKAEPGEEISVTFGAQSVRTKADGGGRWSVDLNLAESKPGPFNLTVSGRNEINVADVLVGEVWLASGQSNMELVLKATIDAEEEIAQSDNPQLREFHVKNRASSEPLEDCEGEWLVAGPDTSGEFSGVGYYFAKRLQHDLRVPVGLIHSSWGATPVEAWTSRPALDRVPALKATTDRHIEEARIYADDKAFVPKTPVALLIPQKFGGYNFNGMINPLIPYAMRGVIWYQGEGNVQRAYQYRTAFPLLIEDWRQQWGRDDFAFYFCQLANLYEKKAEPGDNDLAELREAQSMTLKLPNTGQAVLIDIGESNDVHPRNKKDAGERLALIALARDYGKELAYSGPVYESMKIEDGKIRLAFSHAAQGLKAKTLPSVYDVRTLDHQTAPLVRNRPRSELEGFAICGADKKWIWADAKIEDGTVVVWAKKVPNPVAVRYAWADNPTCNLYNGAGLPASPFRTDDFPAVTQEVTDW